MLRREDKYNLKLKCPSGNYLEQALKQYGYWDNYTEKEQKLISNITKK